MRLEFRVPCDSSLAARGYTGSMESLTLLLQMSSHRPAMVASLIRTLAGELVREVPPEECGIVSITDVQVSNDLSLAKIYVSSLQHPEKALHYLQGRKGELRSMIAGELQAHHVPALRFVIDEWVEKGNRLDELLK